MPEESPNIGTKKPRQFRQFLSSADRRPHLMAQGWGDAYPSSGFARCMPRHTLQPKHTDIAALEHPTIQRQPRGASLADRDGIVASSTRHPFGSEAASCSGSTRVAPDVVQDFAFADTVVAADLDEVVPPSGIVVSEEHHVTALDYPLDQTSYEPPPSARGHNHHAYAEAPASYPANYETPYEYGHYAQAPMQAPASWWDRVRFGMKRSREEMTLLWSATASLEQTHDGQGAVIHENDPFLRAATVGRRVRTLWSFFEWDRTDLVRAAWIGLLVFVLAATVGAFVLGSSSTSTSRSTPGSSVMTSDHGIDVGAAHTYTQR